MYYPTPCELDMFSELQARYPDGLIFEMIDFHDQPFRQKFPGLGQTIKADTTREPTLPVIKVSDPRLIETDVSREMGETKNTLGDKN